MQSRDLQFVIPYHVILQYCVVLSDIQFQISNTPNVYVCGGGGAISYKKDNKEEKERQKRKRCRVTIRPVFAGIVPVFHIVPPVPSVSRENVICPVSGVEYAGFLKLENT